jgi:FkbM family methyltransferase
VVLDAKNYFVRPLRKLDFFGGDGKPNVFFTAVNPGFTANFRASFELMGVYSEALLTKAPPDVTPFTFNTADAKELCASLTADYGSVSKAFVANPLILEFYLYSAFLLKKYGGWESIATPISKPHYTMFSTDMNGAPSLDIAADRVERIISEGKYCFAVHRKAVGHMSASLRETVAQYLHRRRLAYSVEEAHAILQQLHDGVKPEAQAPQLLTKRVYQHQVTEIKKPEHYSNVVIADILDALAKHNGDKVNVVQVGGNDGSLADPVAAKIKAHKFAALIIEPVKPYFDALQKSYQEFPRVNCLMVAVGDHYGVLPIFTVAPELVESQKQKDGQYWLQGIASLSKDHLVKHGVPETAIEQHSVYIKTLEGCISSAGLQWVDVFVVDVEGAEEQVFDGFALEHWRPSVVFFESPHLEADARSSMFERLHYAGYEITNFHPDCIAIHRDSPHYPLFKEIVGGHKLKAMSSSSSTNKPTATPGLGFFARKK